MSAAAGSLGTAARLWRYPASSLGGEAMETISVERESVSGDRMYGVVDAATSRPGAPDKDRRWHPLPRIRTRLDTAGSLHVALPGGGWMQPGEECDAALSAFLGFPASLRPYAVATVGIPPDDATQPRYKAAPIHLLTTASLARLKALHPSGNPDPRRFRPNILVDMAEVEGAFPETGWIGRRIAIGEVEMTISEPCRRCGFTIIAQDALEDDPGILRTLVRHNGHNLGVYCTVDRPGRITRGDEARLI